MGWTYKKSVNVDENHLTQDLTTKKLGKYAFKKYIPSALGMWHTSSLSYDAFVNTFGANGHVSINGSMYSYGDYGGYCCGGPNAMDRLSVNSGVSIRILFVSYSSTMDDKSNHSLEILSGSDIYNTTLVNYLNTYWTKIETREELECTNNANPILTITTSDSVNNIYKNTSEKAICGYGGIYNSTTGKTSYCPVLVSQRVSAVAHTNWDRQDYNFLYCQGMPHYCTLASNLTSEDDIVSIGGTHTFNINDYTGKQYTTIRELAEDLLKYYYKLI